jgi:hypothetical protein
MLSICFIYFHLFRLPIQIHLSSLLRSVTSCFISCFATNVHDVFHSLLLFIIINRNPKKKRHLRIFLGILFSKIKNTCRVSRKSLRNNNFPRAFLSLTHVYNFPNRLIFFFRHFQSFSSLSPLSHRKCHE